MPRVILGGLTDVNQLVSRDQLDHTTPFAHADTVAHARADATCRLAFPKLKRCGAELRQSAASLVGA